MEVRRALFIGVWITAACGGSNPSSGEAGPTGSSVTSSDSSDSSSPGDSVGSTHDSPAGDDGATQGESESETGEDGGEDPVDPGYPDFPEVIDTLSVTVRTADVEFAGTNDGHLQLCLTADQCFVLDTVGTEDQNDPWPNEFIRGETDTFHFDGVGLSRADVDRVELRTSDGENAFRPACISLRFDGEPVHCNDTLDVLIGSSPNESLSYVDPEGVHNACTSCYEPLTAGGPLLGAVAEDRAHVWVRTDATRRVTVMVSDDQQPEDEWIAAYLYPSPKDDFVAEAVIPDLEPNRAYRYRFDIDGRGATEPITFFSAPAPGGQQTRIAMGSCSRDYPAPIFSHVLAAEPDIFLHLGDNHYANSNYAGTTDAERLAILRWHYRRSLMQAERAELAATIPSLAVWDDHDYVGNNAIGSAVGREAALQAFDEYWANSTLGTENTPGTFSIEHYGDIDLFLLDDRYYRSDESEQDGSIVGDAQFAWLLTELEQSTAVFKFLVSGSLFSLAGESWTDFPAERAALFDHIEQNEITGVVLLSGDIHRSLFRRIPRPGTYALPELVSSPLNNNNGTCKVDPNAEELGCYDDSNYFMTIDIDTTLPDPEVVASIINESAQTVASFSVLRSELE